MYATAAVEGNVFRFKLSPALARAHRENRGKTMTKEEAVAFVEAKRRSRARRQNAAFKAVRKRRPARGQIEDALAWTAAVKLAMIAYDTGSRITWDAGKESIVGNREAARLLKGEHRAPWKHPCTA